MRKYLPILAVAGLLLCSALFAGCTTTNTFNTTTTLVPGRTGTSGSAASTTISLLAQNFAFDTKTITVPAGAQISIIFNNRDTGVLHNVAIYTDASATTPILEGLPVAGPGATTYTFIAPSTPGTYFFRCDVHPTTMNGQFIVQ